MSSNVDVDFVIYELNNLSGEAHHVILIRYLCTCILNKKLKRYFIRK